MATLYVGHDIRIGAFAAGRRAFAAVFGGQCRRRFDEREMRVGHPDRKHGQPYPQQQLSWNCLHDDPALAASLACFGCYSSCLPFSLPPSSGIAAPALATAVGVCGAALGLWLTGLRERARVVVPFSAGVLLGVALFGLLPELASEIGWPISLALFAAGYGALLLVNRFVYRVCPTCAHDHDHNACATELHGFAAPLIAAAAVHSFLDGWSIATVQLTVPLGLRVAVPLAVALHKVPEGIALGGILRASVKSRSAAFGWARPRRGRDAGRRCARAWRWGRTWEASGSRTRWESPPDGSSIWGIMRYTRKCGGAARGLRSSRR